MRLLLSYYQQRHQEEEEGEEGEGEKEKNEEECLSNRRQIEVHHVM